MQNIQIFQQALPIRRKLNSHIFYCFPEISIDAKIVYIGNARRHRLSPIRSFIGRKMPKI